MPSTPDQLRARRGGGRYSPGAAALVIRTHIWRWSATLVIGKDHLLATIAEHASFSHEILDTWRSADEDMVRSWEERFRLEKGFIEALRESVSKGLERFGRTINDYSKVIFSAPDARAHREAARALGLDAAQVQDGLFSVLGHTGTAFPLMLLIAALEDAQPGDRLLLASYGDGCDVFSLQVTAENAGTQLRTIPQMARSSST